MSLIFIKGSLFLALYQKKLSWINDNYLPIKSYRLFGIFHGVMVNELRSKTNTEFDSYWALHTSSLVPN